ncbi:M1 family metallopeptidase [soil metagenome]
MVRPVVLALVFAVVAQGASTGTPRDAIASASPDFTVEDAALPAHAEDVVDYTLTATLDPTAHTVHGEGTIVFKNTSTRGVHELWLHLYLNAFKNERSVFLREPVGRFRGGGGVRDWGFIDVKKLELRGGGQAGETGPVDLWKTAELHRLGDDDETDARVPLPTELAPGEQITLDVAWDDKLPRVVERTGYDGTFHMIAQWFPKLARLEPDGTWAHFPFHHLAEFYADFGTYDVTMKVPKGYTIAASGPVTDAHDEGELHVERHLQGDIHDFAWSVYDRFEVLEEGIDGVDVKVFYPKGYHYVADRELRSMRFAIPYFGKRYGKYPYGTLNLVHPPDGAGEAGGMEYPTLITTGGPWVGPPGVMGVELVTIHEFGHQYFYGMLASDEVTWPFLDEGMNSYAESESMEAWLGEGSMVDLFGLRIADSTVQGASARRAADTKVAQPAFAFTGRDYGALVYGRTAAIFGTVDRVYGKDRGALAIGRYTRQARFRHPRPDDLLAAYEEVFGPDVRAMLHDALFEKGWVDFLVDGIQSNAIVAPAGVFDHDGKPRETVGAGTGKTGEFEGWALIRRHGTLQLPVDVDLHFDDGSIERRVWDGRDESTRIEVRGPKPLVGAVVDPEHKILIDLDFSNDFQRASGRGSVARSLERGLYFGELVSSVLGP